MLENPILMEAETDRTVWAEAAARHAMFERNWEWLESNAAEVHTHRGKFVCIAGQELFVGDSVDQVLRAATAAHPEDHRALYPVYPSPKHTANLCAVVERSLTVSPSRPKVSPIYGARIAAVAWCR